MDTGMDAMDLVGAGWFDDGGGAHGNGDREFDAVAVRSQRTTAAP